MPKLDSQTLNTASGFNFSGERIENLSGSDKYSLVSIVVDVSGSTNHFNSDCINAVANIIEGCKKSPEKDMLLIRLLRFGSRLHEVFGFTLLDKIEKSDIDLPVGGMTSLYDACSDGVEATLTYADNLAQNYYRANGLVVVLTDGGENNSLVIKSPDKIAKIIQDAKASEKLDSIKTVLIGLTNEDALDGYFLDFKNRVNFDQYIKAADVSAKGWAKMQGFISSYISSTSQALGTGKPSASLTF